MIRKNYINNEKDTQICKGCLIELPFNSIYFTVRNDLKTGFYTKCKKCEKEIRLNRGNNKQIGVPSGFYKCSCCRNVLPLSSEFFTKRCDSKTGYNHRCKKCLYNDYNRKIKKEEENSLKNLLRDRISGARNRSKTKNLDCDIDVDYLNQLWEQQNGICALTGMKMEHTYLNGKNPKNVSVDRIDAKIGYIKGNIQLVCGYANFMKSDIDETSLYIFCKGIVDYYEYKIEQL